MVFTFPIRRVEGNLVKGVIRLPREAMYFVPFSDFYAIESSVNRFPFLSVYPHEIWFPTFLAVGFVTERSKVPRGAAYIKAGMVSGRPALLVPQPSLEYLRPKSDSFVLIGQGYNFEIWNGETFRQYATQIIEEWETEGSIDTRLVMRKWHPWNLLRALVIVELIGQSNHYRTNAELKASDVTLHRLDYMTEGKYKTERDLGRLVISLFDAYIEGATNTPEILAVHEACKIKIPGASNYAIL